MIQCLYCGRWFKNKQALRAHLKHCPAKTGKILNDGEEFLKLLLAEYIIMLFKKGKAVSGTEFIQKVGITEDQLLKFVNWMERNRYDEILKLVVKARKTKSTTKA